MSDEFVEDTKTEIPETVEPVLLKKRRGRPPKNASAVEGDAAYVEPSPDNVDAPKKRGRKAKRPSVDVLAQQIKGLHAVAAHVTGQSVIMISDAESNMLANSLNEVMDQFDFAPSGKVAALVGLFGTAAVVYIPRLVHVNRMRKAESAKHVEPTEQTANNIEPNEQATQSAANEVSIN